MLNLLKNILMDKATDDGAAGGGAPATKPDETPPPKADDKKVEEKGNNLDDLGYEKKPADDKKPGDDKKAGDDKSKDPVEKPKEVVPATGYDKEPEKVEEVKKVEVPPPVLEGLDKKLEGLHPSLIKLAKDQIAELEVTDPAKQDKLIARLKVENQASLDFQKNQELERVRLDKAEKAKWYKELKDDPVFGGGKFELNVVRADKILDQYIPELKKRLTDAKGMLPPDLMRGLARIADDLYPDDKLVQGDPPPVEGKDGKGGKDEKADPLDFYRNG